MATRSGDEDLEGADTDDMADDDSPSGISPAKPSLNDRIRSRLQPPDTARTPTSKSTSPSPAQSTKRIVERLDDRERRLCFAASGLAVLAGIVIYVVEHENSHFRLRKGELTPETTLVIGFAVGALLLVATLIGRRAPVGFVALFAFLAFGTQYFAGIPFLVLAVWLLVRSYKYQKEAAATRKASMAGGVTPARGGPRGSSPTSSRTGASRSVSKGTSTKGPSTPEANKRYTPKRAPLPPPKPSRRERKAAQASD